MVASFYLYLEALLPHWWAFMMGGPFIIDEAAKWLCPSLRGWLSRKLQRPARRRRVEIALMLFGVFLAGFLAFNDEHEARLRDATVRSVTQNSAAEIQKRLAMKNLLATVIDEGNALSNEDRTDADAYLHEANIWANKTGHLIEDAYGPGELDLWKSGAGITNYIDPRYPSMKVRNAITNRLQRLNELMPRVDALSMRPGFDPNNYKWVTQCADPC